MKQSLALVTLAVACYGLGSLITKLAVENQGLRHHNELLTTLCEATVKKICTMKNGEAS